MQQEHVQNSEGVEATEQGVGDDDSEETSQDDDGSANVPGNYRPRNHCQNGSGQQRRVLPGTTG
jgi:hypothetical protein